MTAGWNELTDEEIKGSPVMVWGNKYPPLHINCGLLDTHKKGCYLKLLYSLHFSPTTLKSSRASTTQKE